jgi:hypothetical protein
MRVLVRGRPRAGLGPNPLHSNTPCRSLVAPELGVAREAGGFDDAALDKTA